MIGESCLGVLNAGSLIDGCKECVVSLVTEFLFVYYSVSPNIFD